MACLDTSFLVDILHKSKRVDALLDELDKKEARLVIATPTVMELWSGALRSGKIEKEKDKVLSLVESLNVLPLDEQSAKKAAEIENALRKNGEPIEPHDVMIAGIAMTHGETIVTRDPHFSRIPDLHVRKY